MTGRTGLQPIHPASGRQGTQQSWNEESNPISLLKVKFNPTCLFPYKSSSSPLQGPSPQTLGAFLGEENPRFFCICPGVRLLLQAASGWEALGDTKLSVSLSRGLC